MNDVFRILPAGDAALLVEFDERVDEAINARAVALAEKLRISRVRGVLDVVSAYRTVAIYFDPLQADRSELLARIAALRADAVDEPVASSELIRVPVCYGAELGPDLGQVARFAGMTENDVVSIHTASTYRVFMLGFAPGFAYMGKVDTRIAAPRRDMPRTRVPAGSVAIAGRQTGVYPLETPGGWQLIGRTPLKPFDARAADPFLFKPGARVRFEAVGRNEYERMITAGHDP